MTKICPHTSTGRADYFGSVVNRAARLLCAANAGQTLVEALVMDDVLKQWSGDAYNLAPIPAPDGSPAGSGGKATLGAALLSSGALPLPDSAESLAAEQDMMPRIKSAPQLSLLEIPEDSTSCLALADTELQPMPNEDTALSYPSMPLDPSQAGHSDNGSMKSWTQQALYAGTRTHMRSSLATRNNKFSKQAVSFAPSGGAIRREGRGSAVTGLSPGRSTDGVSYHDSEMQQLVVTDSCCAPFAAGDPLAVSNCHMLKFLAASGTLQGRPEDAIAPQRMPHQLGKSTSLSVKRSPCISQDLPRNLSSRSASSSTANGGLRLSGLKLSADIPPTGFVSQRSKGTNLVENSSMTALLSRNSIEVCVEHRYPKVDCMPDCLCICAYGQSCS